MDCYKIEDVFCTEIALNLSMPTETLTEVIHMEPDHKLLLKFPCFSVVLFICVLTSISVSCKFDSRINTPTIHQIDIFEINSTSSSLLQP